MPYMNGNQIYLRSNLSVSEKPFEQFSWKTIQALVRSGEAQNCFKVGDTLQCSHDRLGTLNWQIVDMGMTTGEVGVPYENGMTLALKEPYGSFAFSSSQAIFYAPNGLPSGQYNFTLPKGYDEEHGGGKTYWFWINNGRPLPAGGYLRFYWQEGSQVTANKMMLYAPITNGVENHIDSLKVTEGSGGTPIESLGQMNPNIESIRMGNNSYDSSALRQLINSQEEAGKVWKPMTKFDRPPAWALTEPGFLNGIDPEFLSVIQPHFTYTAKYGETAEPEMLNDRVRLFGWEEINGVYRGGNVKDADQNTSDYVLDYYKGIDPTDKFYDKRVKTYKDGKAAYWWLRSKKLDQFSSKTAIVNANGSLNYVQPYNSNNGVVPVCVIY